MRSRCVKTSFHPPLWLLCSAAAVLVLVLVMAVLVFVFAPGLLLEEHAAGIVDWLTDSSVSAWLRREVVSAAIAEYAAELNSSGCGTDHQDGNQHVSCYPHHLERVLAMVPLRVADSHMPENAIHFLLTSGAGRVEMRQICAIESAARHNPGRHVVVSVWSNRLLWTKPLGALFVRYPNVQFVQLNITERFNDTPIGGGWLKRGLLEVKKAWKSTYLADIARSATIFKHGGVYLDADMISLRPLESNLTNAVSLETNGTFLNNNFLAFSKGHPMMLDLLRWHASHFSTSERGSNGPHAITNLVRVTGWCSMGPSEVIVSCRGGVELLPRSAFNPVDYYQVWACLFSEGDGDDNGVGSSAGQGQHVASTLDLLAKNRSYAVHLYNYMSSGLCIRLDSTTQPVAALARAHCPTLVQSIQGRQF